jgi:mono/diheme cytochrome c family protein
MKKLFVKIGFFSSIFFLISCGGDDSSPGLEFMPNMYRSPSIETYGEHIVLRDTSYMIEGYTGIPVKGTIAQGYLSTFNYGKDIIGSDSLFLLAGNSAKYPEEFDRDENDLEKGKELYGIMCAHCHGDQGGGDGLIAKASFANNPYDVMPAFNDSEQKRPRNNLPMTDFTEGHIFHTITYGYGKMGPHASQISEKERWKIVYYIQEKLQK